MTETPKSKKSVEDAANASDIQWDAALRNQSLPNTPVDMQLMARSVR